MKYRPPNRGPLQAVTVSAVPTLTGTHHATFDVIATADADTTATVTHGLGQLPKSLIMLPQHTAYYTSVWVETSRSTTTVVCTKGTGGGSGNAAVQLRVEVAKPHSIVD